MFFFLIYFLGGLFDMIIIDFHWKGLYFSFVVKTFWHDWRKNILSCFMFFWDHFVCVFMNIFEFSLKTEIPFVRDHFVFYYEFVKELKSLYFCYKLLSFCISIILVWWVECLVVWRLCKRTIISVIKYKYNTNAI